MVHFKIEPMNQTKKLVFYKQKYKDLEKFDEDVDDNALIQNKNASSIKNYKIHFRNMIGISIIDCQPMELLQISFRNLKLNYVVTEEKVQNLNKMATLDLESSGFSTHLSAFNTIKLQEESSIINTNELI